MSDERITFIEWMRHSRTKKLLQQIKFLQQHVNVIRGAGLVQLEEAQRLRAVVNVRDEKLAELERRIRTLENAVELQTRRLISARKHVARIRYHCDMPEIGDT